MNQATKEKLAKMNKCEPDQVHCDNCFYLSSLNPYCEYHKCSLLDKSQACYKFKYVRK